MVYHGQTDLTHLSWDHTSNLLAIVDACGRISICLVYVAINRMSVLRRCTIDAEDDLGSIVGLIWLHIDRPENVC